MASFGAGFYKPKNTATLRKKLKMPELRLRFLPLTQKSQRKSR
jgi:hypothetical protein